MSELLCGSHCELRGQREVVRRKMEWSAFLYLQAAEGSQEQSKEWTHLTRLLLTGLPHEQKAEYDNGVLYLNSQVKFKAA